MNARSWRPSYHFLPERNWMNDPNGLLEWDGMVHLFYQHNPVAPVWGDIHWGHATSTDMVHWTHQPIALRPLTERGEKHCYSGCGILDDAGNPVLFYTSVGEGLRDASIGAEQWVARTVDGVTWMQAQENPVLTLASHGGMKVCEWRDPYVWREEDGWYMVVGGGHDGVGCVLRYRSEDLLTWTFLGILYEDPAYSIIECPNLLMFGDTAVLIFSPNEEVQVRIGHIGDTGRLELSMSGYTFDGGGWQGYYAPQTLKRKADRFIQWGWMPEGARGQVPEDAPLAEREARTFDWAGVLSIPRELTLDASGRLNIVPIPELEALRGEPVQMAETTLVQDLTALPLKGLQIEFMAAFHLDPDARIEISIFRSRTGEETILRYDAGSCLLELVRASSSLDPHTAREPLSVLHPLATDGLLQLRVFLDVSTVEVFADDSSCLSGRVYPTGTDGEMAIRSAGSGSAILKELIAWPMKGIWDAPDSTAG